MSAFIEGDAFIDQLFQLVQFLLADFQELDPEGLVVDPLDLRLVDRDRFLDSRKNELHHDLPARLNNQAAFEPGAAERKIDRLAFDLVRVRAQETLDLRVDAPMLPSFHRSLPYRVRGRKSRQTNVPDR